MPSKEMTTASSPVIALTTQVISSDTTTASSIIDLQGYESCQVAIITGTITDGDYTLTVQDGDDSGLSDAASVDSTLIIHPSGQTALPSFDSADDNVVKRFGLVNHKRYIRVNIVSTNTTSGGTFTILVMKELASSRPTT